MILHLQKSKLGMKDPYNRPYRHTQTHTTPHTMLLNGFVDKCDDPWLDIIFKADGLGHDLANRLRHLFQVSIQKSVRISLETLPP